MSRFVPLVPFVVMFTLLSAACSDDDAARTDSGPLAEAGVEGGPQADLAPTPDTSPDTSTTGCDPALELSPLDLDTAYCVAARFELASMPAGFAYREGALWTFSMEASAPFSGEVLGWTVDPSTGELGVSTSVFGFTPNSSAETLFAGGYLALSPAGFAAVGYTEDQTFDGEIFWGDEGIETPHVVSKVSGNFDVVFIDDQILLVNGSGVGEAQQGQGIYLVQQGKPARLLIDQMGDFSGHLARGQTVLYAGGFFGSGNKVYGFTLAEIESAIQDSSTISANSDGDLIHEGGLQSASVLGDDLVIAAVDDAFAFSGVQRLPVSVNGDTLQAGAPVDMVTPGGGVSVMKLSASGDRLALLLAGEKTEIAVVQEP